MISVVRRDTCYDCNYRCIIFLLGRRKSYCYYTLVYIIYHVNCIIMSPLRRSNEVLVYV